MFKKPRKKKSEIWKISREDLIELLEKSSTFVEVLAFFHLKNKGANYKTLVARLLHEGLDWQKFKNNRSKIHKFAKAKPIQEILVKGKEIGTFNLKKRLLEEGILQKFCKICGLKNWGGKELSLVLDHIDGDRSNNLLENLRLLCPNCNSQTSTFAGRNRRKKFGPELPPNFMKLKKRRPQESKCPSVEVLTDLLQEKPSTHIAKQFGVSDTTIIKWAKKHNLTKPPRGYWSRLKKLKGRVTGNSSGLEPESCTFESCPLN